MSDDSVPAWRKPLTRSQWRRQQLILWMVALGGGGAAMWWIETADWPSWAKLILSFATVGFFSLGAPATYGAYLKDEEERADFADLLGSGRGGVLSKCRGCGRRTRVEEPFCVRCGIPDPIPNAKAALWNVRFLSAVGYATIVAVAVTIIYLLGRALV
jgi:hypothetical protein